MSIAPPTTRKGIAEAKGGASQLQQSPAQSGDELLNRIAILEVYGLADTACDVLPADAELVPMGFRCRRWRTC